MNEKKKKKHRRKSNTQAIEENLFCSVRHPARRAREAAHAGTKTLVQKMNRAPTPSCRVARLPPAAAGAGPRWRNPLFYRWHALEKVNPFFPFFPSSLSLISFSLSLFPSLRHFLSEAEDDSERILLKKLLIKKHTEIVLLLSFHRPSTTLKNSTTMMRLSLFSSSTTQKYHQHRQKKANKNKKNSHSRLPFSDSDRPGSLRFHLLLPPRRRPLSPKEEEEEERTNKTN